MFKYLVVVLLTLCLGCTTNSPITFSKKALSEELITLNNTSKKLEQILEENAGEKILVNIWASWCRDCLVSFSRTKQLQKKYPNIKFVFISVDKNNTAWKNAIQKHQLKGQHYNLPKGSKSGDLVTFLDVAWIPRYMVVGKNKEILLFKATKIYDKKIEEALTIAANR